MIEIYFIQSIAGFKKDKTSFAYSKGKVVSMPTDEANSFLDNKIAVRYDDHVSATKNKARKAVPVKPRTKKFKQR